MMELLHALGVFTAALEKLAEKLGSGYLESFEPLENIQLEDVRAKLSALSRAGQKMPPNSTERHSMQSARLERCQ